MLKEHHPTRDRILADGSREWSILSDDDLDPSVRFCVCAEPGGYAGLLSVCTVAVTDTEETAEPIGEAGDRDREVVFDVVEAEWLLRCLPLAIAETKARRGL